MVYKEPKQEAGGDEQSERPTCGIKVLITANNKERTLDKRKKRTIKISKLLPLHIGSHIEGHKCFFLTSPMLKGTLAATLGRVEPLQHTSFQLSSDQGILNQPDMTTPREISHVIRSPFIILDSSS